MAFRFTAASSQRISFTRAAGMEGATNKITLSVWLMVVGSSNNYARVLTKEYNNGNSSPYGSYSIERGNGADVFFFNIGTAGGQFQAGGNTTLSANTWYHLCGVYDGSLGSNNGVLYIDGVAESTKFSHTGNIIYHTGAGNLDVGGNSGGGNYLDGRVCEPAVWTDAVSIDEVTALAAGRNPLRFRPSSRIFHHPLEGWESAVTDYIQQFSSSIVNTPTREDHAPVEPWWMVGNEGSIPFAEEAAPPASYTPRLSLLGVG